MRAQSISILVEISTVYTLDLAVSVWQFCILLQLHHGQALTGAGVLGQNDNLFVSLKVRVEL